MKRGGNFSLTIPIVEIIVKASADWNDFESRRKTHFERVHYTSTTDESRTELRIVTSEVAYGAWVECMKICSRQQYGFYGWKQKENENGIWISVYFNAPPRVRSVRLSGDTINGKVRGQPNGVFPKSFNLGANEMKTFIVERTDRNKKTSITIEAGGYSDPVILDSTWANLPAHTGKLVVYRNEKSVREWGKISEQFTSPDRHEKSHFQNTFVLTAAKGRKLKSVTPPRYLGPPPELARTIKKLPGNFREAVRRQWNEVDKFSKRLSVTISSDGRTATTILDTWSRPAYWEITASEYEDISQAAETSSPLGFDFDKPFYITVPSSANAAVMFLSIDGAEFPVKVGQSSRGGAIQLLETIPAGPGWIVYQYVVKANSGRPSAEDWANAMVVATSDN